MNALDWDEDEVITRQQSLPPPARPRVRIIGVHDVALDWSERPTSEMDRPKKSALDRLADLSDESLEIDLGELEEVELDADEVQEIASPRTAVLRSEIRELAPRGEPGLSPLPDSWSLPQIADEDDDEPEDSLIVRRTSPIVPRARRPRRGLMGAMAALLAVCAGGLGFLFWPRAPLPAEAHAEVPAGKHAPDALRAHRAPPREAAISEAASREVATTAAPTTGQITSGKVTLELETQGARVVLAPRRGPRRALPGPWPMTLDLDPGAYDIIAVRTGYRPKLVSLQVAEGTDERVTIALVPAPLRSDNADIYE